MAVGGRTVCEDVVEHVAAVDEIVAIEVREFDGARTGGAVLGTAGMLFGIMIAVVANQVGGS